MRWLSRSDGGSLVHILAFCLFLSLGADSRAAAQTQPTAGVPQLIHESEGRFDGIWRWNNGHFDAIWDNGAIATLTVQSFTAQSVTLNRTDSIGTTPGLTAVYTGQISGQGGSIVNGHVTFTWPGHFSQPPTGAWTATWETGGSGCVSPPPERGTDQIPQFQKHYQLMSNWCWAAAAEMVMQNLPNGADHPQCEIVGKVALKGKDCCAADAQGCNVQGSIYQALTAYGLHYALIKSFFLTPDDIKKSISCNHSPLVYSISKDASHTLVIYGWETFGDKLTLMIFDPGQYPLGQGMTAQGKDLRANYGDLFGPAAVLPFIINYLEPWPIPPPVTIPFPIIYNVGK